MLPLFSANSTGCGNDLPHGFYPGKSEEVHVLIPGKNLIRDFLLLFFIKKTNYQIIIFYV